MLTTSAPTEKERIMNKMDEYIKKNALYEKIAQLEEFSRDRYLETPSDNPCRSRYLAELVERTYFKRIIADFPTADVEPVRHGRWIMGTNENGLQAGHRKCSRCGEIVKYGYSLYGVHNFCNYCGARMDGDDVNG